jgi:hypothetical protein
MVALRLVAARRRQLLQLLNSFTKFSLFLIVSGVILAGSARPTQAETLTVSSGGDLQAAINAARPGDTIEVEAGAQFVGPFTLPDKGASAEWITIRTSTPDTRLPSPTTRVSPADAPLLARLVSPGYGEAALQTSASAHHYRLVGLEITTVDASALVYDLVKLGDGTPAQDTLEKVPHHLVLDRCLIRAYPTQTLKRGVALHSRETEIVNCYIAGFKSEEQDAQAVGGWNGPGPFRVVNNYLEASGENLMFGGARPSIAGLVPSDITILRNHLAKPVSWKPGEAEYAGRKWVVKNLFELKSAKRVLFEGNLLEYCWGDLGYGSINLTVRGDSGPQATLEDITIRRNVLRHTANGFNVLGRDTMQPSQQGRGLRIEGNLLYDVDGPRWGGGGGEFLKISAMPETTVDHNTALHSGNTISVYGPVITNFVLTNNLMMHNKYGILGQDHAPGTHTLKDFFPAAVVRRNVIVGANFTDYPPDNFYPTKLEKVGLVSPARADYRLRPDSPYKGKATDGKDIGCDFDAVEAAIAGVAGR